MLRVFLFVLMAVSLNAQTGVVRSAGQPIPGAMVTATQGPRHVVAFTDENGGYQLSGLEAGAYSVDIRMFGFKPAHRDLDSATPTEWTLELLPKPTARAAGQGAGRNVIQLQAEGQIEAAIQAAAPPPDTAGQTSGNANEAFLVNGSLSRGLQSGPDDGQQQPRADGGFGQRPGGGPPGTDGNFPTAGGGGARGFGQRGGGFGGPGGGRGGFGGANGGPGARGPRNGQQPGAIFGNRAGRGREGLHGNLSLSLRNSAADARPFSLNGQDTQQAGYAQSRFSFVIGGPLRIPKVWKSDSTFFFLSYFGTRAKNPYKNVATVPTALERIGNFSEVPGASIFDPTTHAPLAGNLVPQNLLNPAALGLLNFIPLPNQPGILDNYQILTAIPQNSDNLGVRLNQNVSKRDRLALNINMQRRSGALEQLYGFRDQTNGSAINADLSYTRNLNQRALNTLRLNFNRNRSETVPFFAFGPDVAAALGIRGASNDAINFGPPNLSFTNYGSLNDASPVLSRVQSIGVSDSITYTRGSHNLSTGVEYRRNHVDTRTDQNARGTFAFSGLLTSAFDANGLPIRGTGYDLADFLIGLPQSSSVRFGSSSTYFRGNTFSAFGQDDWRARRNLSVNLGLRYEYYSPLSEKYGRIANLDIAPNFTAATLATPGLLGLPLSLVRPDRNNFAPRVAISYKPHAEKPLQFRASYGVYYNGTIYNQIASRLAGQPPFAQTETLTTSEADLLTLQNGLTATSSGKQINNTYAVDANYRVGYAQTWNVAVQNELPGAIVVELGYLGTKGTRLDIQRLPNRAAPGSPLTAEQRRQIGNAVGFLFESSDGNSIYHAAQLRVTRRFRRGLSFNALYTYSKSIDDSSTFGGAGNTVAQDDNNLRAERGLSSFDQRHVLNLTSMLASPTNTNRRLLKNWTITGGLAVASGLPLTARVLGNAADAAGTGSVGSGRADSTGATLAGGEFFNLGAFTIPPAGRFGDAGRNTITAPSTFSVNASIGRYFPLGERRRLEFRIESANLTNHVNITNIITVVNASNYGLPIAAGPMRTLTANLRFRF